MKHPIAPVIIYTDGSTVATASGAATGQEVVFINKGTSSVTLAFGGTAVGLLKGSVAAVVPPTATLTLREFGGGALHETARSF